MTISTPRVFVDSATRSSNTTFHRRDSLGAAKASHGFCGLYESGVCDKLHGEISRICGFRRVWQRYIISKYLRTL